MASTSDVAPAVFQTRAGAYALIVEGGRILLSSWEGSGTTVWTLPGGGLELGESAEQACLREVFEAIDDPRWDGGNTPHPLMPVNQRYEPMRKITHPGERIV